MLKDQNHKQTMYEQKVGQECVLKYIGVNEIRHKVRYHKPSVHMSSVKDLAMCVGKTDMLQQKGYDMILD